MDHQGVPLVLVLGFNTSLGDCAAAACCRLPMPTGPAYCSLCVLPLDFGLGAPWSISRESKSPPISYLPDSTRTIPITKFNYSFFQRKVKVFFPPNFTSTLFTETKNFNFSVNFPRVNLWIGCFSASLPTRHSVRT
jgi:hypothetical protein